MKRPVASVTSALGGKVPGPAKNGASPLSIGSSGAASSVVDMLSRPKRSRRKGYKKTSIMPHERSGDMLNLAALPPVI